VPRQSQHAQGDADETLGEDDPPVLQDVPADDGQTRQHEAVDDGEHAKGEREDVGVDARPEEHQQAESEGDDAANGDHPPLFTESDH